jgi:hypothetical protein
MASTTALQAVTLQISAEVTVDRVVEFLAAHTKIFTTTAEITEVAKFPLIAIRTSVI